MDPITLALAGGGIQIVGSLLGQAFASGDRAAAEEIRQKAAALFGEENVSKIIAESQLGPSEWRNYQADPQALAAQRLALQRLQEDATTPGLNAEERFDRDEAMGDAAQYEQGQRGAILQNAQARNVGGSGLELAQQLLSQQGGAMRGNVAGRNAQAQAARRRALANMQMGEFGSQMRRQGFDEFGAKASAQDAIARFNAQNTKDLRQWGLANEAEALSQQAGAREGAANQTAGAFAGASQGAGEMLGSLSDYELRKKYGGGYG